jgi:dihydroorotate dehydrogenase
VPHSFPSLNFENDGLANCTLFFNSNLVLEPMCLGPKYLVLSHKKSRLSIMACDFLYKQFARPLLFQMDSEDAHNFTHAAAKVFRPLLPVAAFQFKYHGRDLVTKFSGVQVRNPIGLAAGFDKNGDLVDLLGYLGFGFAEIGSITAQPRQGNPRPRVFRLPDDLALINRLGLNSQGADLVSRKLGQSKFSLPVGINIAKTNDPKIVGKAATADMLYTFAKVKDLPISYVTLNASCPNTEEGIIAEVDMLDHLFCEVQRANDHHLPVFVKLSPDSTQQLVQDIVSLAKKWQLSGYVCGNTSTSRAGLHTKHEVVEHIGNGGLSGRPLKQLALELCRMVNALKTQEQVIIGCGGIASGADAYEFIRSGACAVHIYTALVYEGPTLVKRMNEELSQLLKRDRLTLSEAIGIDSSVKSGKVETPAS